MEKMEGGFAANVAGNMESLLHLPILHHESFCYSDDELGSAFEVEDEQPLVPAFHTIDKVAVERATPTKIAAPSLRTILRTTLRKLSLKSVDHENRDKSYRRLANDKKSKWTMGTRINSSFSTISSSSAMHEEDDAAVVVDEPVVIPTECHVKEPFSGDRLEEFLASFDDSKISLVIVQDPSGETNGSANVPLLKRRKRRPSGSTCSHLSMQSPSREVNDPGNKCEEPRDYTITPFVPPPYVSFLVREEENALVEI